MLRLDGEARLWWKPHQRDEHEHRTTAARTSVRRRLRAVRCSAMSSRTDGRHAAGEHRPRVSGQPARPGSGVPLARNWAADGSRERAMNTTSVPREDRDALSQSACAEPWGYDLSRPECVLTTRGGHVFVPDWRGGVTWIRPDGAQRRCSGRMFAAAKRHRVARQRSFPDRASRRPRRRRLRTRRRRNGAAVSARGPGCAPGAHQFRARRVGRRLDHGQHTARAPHSARCRDVADGYIVRVDNRGARIVAERPRVYQ